VQEDLTDLLNPKRSWRTSPGVVLAAIVLGPIAIALVAALLGGEPAWSCWSPLPHLYGDGCPDGPRPTPAPDPPVAFRGDPSMPPPLPVLGAAGAAYGLVERAR